MLLSLSIQNFILIDSLSVTFDKGLCVLSGETGAGKSILLEAIKLVLGQRGNASYLRNVGKPASISCEFTTSNDSVISIMEGYGIPFEDTILIKRILYPDGKSKAFVNGEMVVLSQLNAITSKMIELSGQNSQQGLADEKNHIVMLDKFAGISDELEQINLLFLKIQDINKEIFSLKEMTEKAKTEQDYIQHVVEELESLSIEDGEEEALQSHRKLLLEAEKLKESLATITNILSNDIVSAFNKAIKGLSRFPEYFSQQSQKLEASLLDSEEIARELNAFLRSIEADSNKLESVEVKLFKIKDISRKYNVPSQELPNFLGKMRQKLAAIYDYDGVLQGLTSQLEILKAQYMEFASDVSLKRYSAANGMSAMIKSELKELKMDQADFLVALSRSEDLTYYGIDLVKFLVSTNSGNKFAPIKDIASGGELSRLMLALQSILYQDVETIIFDEIDAGIGGKVSASVGKKLKLLANGKNAREQVIVITHQPQVAAWSDNHYLVSKTDDGEGRVSMTVQRLESAQKTHEIARMMTDENITQEALMAAAGLIENSKLYS